MSRSAAPEPTTTPGPGSDQGDQGRRAAPRSPGDPCRVGAVATADGPDRCAAAFIGLPAAAMLSPRDVRCRQGSNPCSAWQSVTATTSMSSVRSTRSSASATPGCRAHPPKAGLLLASWDSDHRALVDRIRGRYPGIELAGATSAGEMSSVLGFAEDSVALALFASDAIDITAGMGRDSPGSPAGLSTSGRRGSSQVPAGTEPVHRIAHDRPRGRLADPGSLAPGTGPDVPILGGGAAPRDPASTRRAASARAVRSRGTWSPKRHRHPPVLRSARLVVRRRHGMARRGTDGNRHQRVDRQRRGNRRAACDGVL